MRFTLCQEVFVDLVAHHQKPWVAAEQLNQGLETIPGFSPHIMGQGVQGVPALFQTGLDGVWSKFTRDGPCATGNKMRDVRGEKIFIPLGFFAKGATCIGEWETQTEPLAKARSVAYAAILGMMATGTAKGWINSDEHRELREAMRADMDEEEFNKFKKKLHGNLKSNTYFPNRNSGNVARRGDVAMQYSWLLEEAYDANENLVGIWLYKLIYDASFSSDEHWRLLMEENAEVARHGTINSVAENQRSTRMLAQNKLQRSQIDPEQMHRTAINQYKRIKTVSDALKMYKIYGGATDSHPGRPLYANIKKDTPLGCEVKPLSRDPKWGGRHPLGPSVAFNHKRYMEPQDGHPGVNVSLAGTIDANNVPINIHPKQSDPNKYYDRDGYFSPPDWVLAKGAMWILHDPSITNIFKAPFPRQLHGSVVPADCLLLDFWELHKDKNPVLLRAQQRGRTTFEQNRDLVMSLFHKMEETLDPEQECLTRAVLDTDLLGVDSLDKSVFEEEQMECRVYGKKNVEKQGDMWVVAHQQVLMDISQEQGNSAAMIDEANKNRLAHINEQIYRSPDFDAATAHTERRAKHAESTYALIRLGLQRFDNAFARKRARRTIPPGWFDICSTGLKAALREAGEIAARRAGVGQGCRVDPNDTNVTTGTANIALGHGRSMVATDTTPFGHWRAFLMDLFSTGCKISGPDVKLMFEIWNHGARLRPLPARAPSALTRARVLVCAAFEP